MSIITDMGCVQKRTRRVVCKNEHAGCVFKFFPNLKGWREGIGGKIQN